METKNKNLSDKIKKHFTTKNMAILSFLSAFSFILYAYAKFNIPIFPEFLDMQFSDLPIILATFMVGIPGGIVVIIMRFLLKIWIIGTSTLYVGELCDVILALTYSATAGFVYARFRTKKGAILALAIGSAASVVAAVIANIFFVIPLYIELIFKGSWTPLLKVTGLLYKNITKETFFAYYIPLAVIPFNALRLLGCSVITFFVYKRLSVALKHLFRETQNDSKPEHNSGDISANS